jgi:hypothetical protein
MSPKSGLLLFVALVTATVVSDLDLSRKSERIKITSFIVRHKKEDLEEIKLDLP